MRTLALSATLLFALVSLAGCGEEFAPASYVDKLRLLAIRAEAPEIAPAGGGAPDRTTLTSLVADPDQLEDPEREVTVVYLACTPEPGSLEAGLCTLVETYADPAQLPALLNEGGGACGGGGAPAPGEFGEGVVGGITFAGLEACDQELGCRPAEVDLGGAAVTLPAPTYVLPASFSLADLPADHPQRTTGVQVVVIAIVVQASPQELVEGADPADSCAFADQVSANLARLLEERERLTALKRLQVRGPDVTDPVNVNPEIPGVLANGAVLAPELAEPVPDTARFRTGQKVSLLPQLPLGDDGKPLSDDVLYQPYTRYDSEGAFFRSEREAWLWSWFTTGGEFEDERTRDADEAQEWTAPGVDKDFPVPESRRVFLYSVVRDARGGIAWAKREVRID